MYYMGYLFKKLNNSAFSCLFVHTVPYLGVQFFYETVVHVVNLNGYVEFKISMISLLFILFYLLLFLLVIVKKEYIVIQLFCSC